MFLKDYRYATLGIIMGIVITVYSYQFIKVTAEASAKQAAEYVQPYVDKLMKQEKSIPVAQQVKKECITFECKHKETI